MILSKATFKYLIIIINLAFSSNIYSKGFSDILFKKQWGIQNNGQIIKRFENRLKRKAVTGIKGQDINFPNNRLINYKSQKEVVVAVVDTGVDINHEDLKGRIWYNKKLCKSKKDEKKLPCRGFNFLTRTPDVTDDIGHGTHVAGIIAANWNDIGIAGVTPENIKIMPIKVLSKEVKGFVHNKRLITDIIADGIRFAIENQADIINLSIGWPKIVQTPKMIKVLNMAYKSNIPVVAAAGNNNKEIITFPCNHLEVICVGATDNRGMITSFSNYGAKVDILAPGESIVSTYPSNLESRVLRTKSYEIKNGTSSAAPFVTGLIANMKLLFPNIGLDEVKARLYSSSKKQNESEKFSNAFNVNFKRALEEKPDYYISPNYKNVQDVLVNAMDGSFEYRLPIKNYLQSLDDVTVKISFDSTDIELLSKSEIKLFFNEGQTKYITIKGRILNILIDSKVIQKLDIFYNEKRMYSGKSSLYFFKELDKERGLIEIDGQNIQAKDVLRIKGDRKFSNLRSISLPKKRTGELEYFFLNNKDQSKKSTVINLIKIVGTKMQTQKLTIDKVDQVLSIFREDINLDGSNDYLIYSFNRKEKKFVLTYLDEYLNPLFKEFSIWNFELSSFQGLPLKYGYMPGFDWLKIYHKKLGAILVPSFIKKWNLPEKDNSKDILLKLPTSKKNHLFYFSPIISDIGIKVELRVLDSFSFFERVRSKLNLDELVPIKLGQKLDQVNTGLVTFIVSSGKEFDKKYYKVKYYDNHNFIIEEIHNQGNYLGKNNQYRIKNANDSSEENYLFVAKINRVRSRFSMADNSSGKVYKLNILRNDWVDPIFDIIASYTSLKAPMTDTFIESRYSVIHLDKNFQQQKLPINRDSSFPSVKFKENLLPIWTSYDTDVTPAIYVDSTQIFGNRVYLMEIVENRFVRPIRKSFKIPNNCIQLLPINFKDLKSYFLPLSCIAKNKKDFKLFLLKL